MTGQVLTTISSLLTPGHLNIECTMEYELTLGGALHSRGVVLLTCHKLPTVTLLLCDI